ncbi:MAG: hypothetical protein AAF799_34470 [Myxococcota bacterium]
MLIVGYIQAAIGGLASLFLGLGLLGLLSETFGVLQIVAVAQLAGVVIFFRQGLLIQASAEHFKAAADDDPDEAHERLMLGFTRLARVFMYDCVAAVFVLVPVFVRWGS